MAKSLPKELADEEGAGAPLPPELSETGEEAPAPAAEAPPEGGPSFIVPAEAAQVFQGAKAGDQFQAEVADVAADGSVTVNIIG